MLSSAYLSLLMETQVASKPYRVTRSVDQAAGGPAPTSVCPPLAAAINNPAGFVDALHAAVDAFVEQKLASAFSVKEQYHNALSRHFPEDMFEEYCSAGPGM